MTKEKIPPTVPPPLAPTANKGEEEGEEEEEATTSPIIEAANKAAERMETANKEHEKLILRQEQLAVEKTLGGTADAGSQSQTKEEKEAAEARKMLEGTGMEDHAFPPPVKNE